MKNGQTGYLDLECFCAFCGTDLGGKVVNVPFVMVKNRRGVLEPAERDAEGAYNLFTNEYLNSVGHMLTGKCCVTEVPSIYRDRFRA